MGILDKIFGNKKANNPVNQNVPGVVQPLNNSNPNTPNPNASSPNTFNPNTSSPQYFSAPNLIEQIERGYPYHFEQRDEILNIYSNRIEYTNKLFGNTPTIIACDINNLSSFMLDYISVEIKGYYNCIKINYYRDSNATITTSLILDFDKQFIYAMQQIARYLNSKVHVKKQYDQEQHIIAEKAEYERLHGTHRYSKQSFSRIEDDYSSKLLLLEEYSNIELLVESSVDLHLVNIDSVVTLSNNGFLINAICDVEGNDTVIGTVANKDFSDSLAGFIENKRLSIISFVSNVDELEKTVSIKIGLFFDMSVTNMKEIPHVDAKLTKTSKKDEFEKILQDNYTIILADNENECLTALSNNHVDIIFISNPSIRKSIKERKHHKWKHQKCHLGSCKKGERNKHRCCHVLLFKIQNRSS